MRESGQCPQRAWCPAAVSALRLGTIRTGPAGREVPWMWGGCSRSRTAEGYWVASLSATAD